MANIQVKDKEFTLSIKEEEILAQIKRVGSEINHDYEGEKPVFLCVLNGAFMFAADLLREVNLPCEICFVKLASYEGTSSTGKVREVIGLNVDITNRHVIIVEDIVETGVTLKHMQDMLAHQNAKSTAICALLQKPELLRVQLDVKYCCMNIPNDFIVGYGLDYDGYGRNYRDIYTLVPKD